MDDTFGTAAPASPELFNQWYQETTPTHDDLVVLATQSGIADVDPEPLSHVAGEGIDPIGDPAAHDAIHELRDRMPR